METINNITNAASKAIWGTNEADQEPVSGVKGNTNQGEPYDAGNIEDPLLKEKKANVADANTASGTTNSASTSEPTTTTGLTTTVTPSTNTASTEPTSTSATDDPLKYKSTPPTESTLTDRSRATENLTPHKSSTTEDAPKHKEDIGKPELNKTSPDGVPPADSAAGKTDTRHPADPATDPAPKGQDVNNNASGPTTGGDKLDGPGPRPLEIVAKERGGDAGNVKKDSAKGGLIKDDSTSGPEDKKEDDPKAVSRSEGTGEKYIKTSGLAVDGGDFDATKPGAGREADRLLDEKDPAHAAAKAAAKSSSDKTSDKSSDKTSEDRTHSPNAGTEKEKESLKDKIKAKLHRH
ncbi:glycine-rich cell wall structural protein 1 [Colletotrichum tofieldiae]|uniref:Glycine-rich cell wall structural protein 1 n=1 Tax=Colletotrichum tofieldiae TaxID=708197 RepID=A0A166Q026_9PEZI|nr:glycine-rich cell wall structural protein 1 [Colletotrichum tofieldiae]GKT53592.1 glycine-rich cell wall structural protein 1 [Colletotrichum tofieldiae]GKT73342.1 glycine-rich cell wall structural protein 1 [Colletotrichum tofieldiae]